MIIKLVGAINDLLWGDLIILEFSGGEIQFGLSLLVLILIPAGLYFTFKTKFLPFRLFPEMIRVTLEKDETKNKILEELNECLKKDRSKNQIIGFTPLDLLEMTRKHMCSND